MHAEFNDIHDIRDLKKKIEKTSRKNNGIRVIGSSTVYFDYDRNEDATNKATTNIKAFFKRNKKNKD